MYFRYSFQYLVAFLCILKFSFCLKFNSEDYIFLWNHKIKNNITITLLKMKLPSISLFGYCFRLDQKKFAHMETSPLKVYKLKKSRVYAYCILIMNRDGAYLCQIWDEPSPVFAVIPRTFPTTKLEASCTDIMIPMEF